MVKTVKKGSITIFLALILSLILSLVSAGLDVETLPHHEHHDEQTHTEGRAKVGEREPAHLYSDRSLSLKLLSALLSDSLNYLPEKTVIMLRPMLKLQLL